MTQTQTAVPARLMPTLTVEKVVTNQNIDWASAERLIERWTAAYPAMRTILDTVIAAQRKAQRPTVDLPRLERVRRELGQVDRGTYSVCARSAPFFSPTDAAWLVRDVIAVTYVAHPQASAIYRLAAELADLAVEDLPPGIERTPEEGA
ncbi:hypothetical protein [Streptomyces anulatus]|uniref:hypothetical protein n=1 Tax=Streptomyces anulatus TaxID=1892 RepID=UPI003870423A|nr:hypothetical protein OHB50_39845 [Streptomyces anulatus]